ncbi:30S ribosomal protein S27ae [Candidatus Woesearchaeota archaeon]|nr:30S ribosomal protein S27ae [Candidatus Woesearchaeota archaeon]
MAKKKESKRKPMQVWKLYKAAGGKAERKNRSCPKCGVGVFLATHKDRVTCGKCSYSEFGSKKEENK